MNIDNIMENKRTIVIVLIVVAVAATAFGGCIC